MKYIPVDCRKALTEGEVPPTYSINENGQLCEVIYEPEDYENYDEFEGEISETDTYYLSGKEEYYGFETVCKSCGTRFMARGEDNGYGYKVRNYCPGCGKRLSKEEEDASEGVHASGSESRE